MTVPTLHQPAGRQGQARPARRLGAGEFPVKAAANTRP